MRWLCHNSAARDLYLTVTIAALSLVMNANYRFRTALLPPPYAKPDTGTFSCLLMPRVFLFEALFFFFFFYRNPNSCRFHKARNPTSDMVVGFGGFCDVIYSFFPACQVADLWSVRAGARSWRPQFKVAVKLLTGDLKLIGEFGIFIWLSDGMDTEWFFFHSDSIFFFYFRLQESVSLQWF